MTNPHHIPIIEDEKIFRETCATKLLQKNSCISTALDGKQDFQSALQNLPDLILLDLLLAKMNGAEVFGKLQATPSTKNIPLILLANIRHFETIFGLFSNIECTRQSRLITRRALLKRPQKIFSSSVRERQNRIFSQAESQL